jgi:hypothetical protein
MPSVDSFLVCTRASGERPNLRKTANQDRSKVKFDIALPMQDATSTLYKLLLRLLATDRIQGQTEGELGNQRRVTGT